MSLFDFKRRLLAWAAAFAVALAPALTPVAAFAADISITATSVVKGSGAKTRSGIAGATVTAGQVVYEAAATGKWSPADANSATAEVRAPVGIALNGAAANQPLTIITEGPVTIGATLTVGAGYYLSGTAGGIAPVADMVTGIYPVFLGFATTSGILDVEIVAAGVAVP